MHVTGIIGLFSHLDNRISIKIDYSHNSVGILTIMEIHRYCQSSSEILKNFKTLLEN